jgi:uncharacterized membrane protein
MKRLQQIVIATQVALLLVFVLGWLWNHRSLPGLIAAVLLALPLLIPLRGLIRGTRRSFAATTLCLLPYLVIALTESIANPAGRARASLGLALVLWQFVALSAYLRASRDTATSIDASLPEENGLHEGDREPTSGRERGHVESIEDRT